MANILFINKDQIDMNLMQFVCKVENCDIVILKSAEEAMQKMAEDRFDLVICDYHLAGMNGLEFFSRIALKGSAFIKVLTSDDLTPEMVHSAFEIGIHECLRKPLTFSSLEPIFAMIGSKTRYAI